MRPAEIDEGTCQLLDIDRIFAINSEVREKIFKSKVFLKPRVSFLPTRFTSRQKYVLTKASSKFVESPLAKIKTKGFQR